MEANQGGKLRKNEANEGKWKLMEANEGGKLRKNKANEGHWK